MQSELRQTIKHHAVRSQAKIEIADFNSFQIGKIGHGKEVSGGKRRRWRFHRGPSACEFYETRPRLNTNQAVRTIACDGL
jgi:hypothetical protein